jgi:ribosomal protein S12 methylthiotransferase
MKTKGNRKSKINIVTLGCSKNLVDSEILYTQLKGNGLSVTHEGEKDDAQIVVINTCGFIDNAKQESIDTILRYVEAKEAGHVEKVIVTGCLSHRYKDELEKEIPLVDSWFGTNELPRLLKTLKADYKKELVGERLLTTPAHYAYLKIAEGCDRPCSFCAIPLMRGKHESRPMEELLLSAKNLAAKGTKEIILIAQDLTYYGLDIYKKRGNFQISHEFDPLNDFGLSTEMHETRNALLNAEFILINEAQFYPDLVEFVFAYLLQHPPILANKDWDLYQTCWCLC